MPHGESWFSLLPFGADLRHLIQVAGKPVSEAEGTWLFHEVPKVQHIYAALFVMFLLGVFAVITDTKIRNAGKDVLPDEKLTIRNVMELLVNAVYGMMVDIMGKKAARYFLPLIGTCFLFILFSNALGLLPGFLPATDNFNTTLAMGLVIFVSTHIYGLKENGFNHIKHLFGPIWWLAWLIFPIELVSHMVRPISLAIRLMANMMADHMVLSIFLGLLMTIMSTVDPALLWWIPLPLPMYLLGMIVVIVQALVFSLLSSVYIGMAIEHSEH